MKPTLLYRIAAVLYVLLAAAHTVGFQRFVPPTAEGVAVEVPVRGSANDVIRDVMGGIRSGMTYCGAATIKDLQRKAQFMTITPAGARESVAHAVERIAFRADDK